MDNLISQMNFWIDEDDQVGKIDIEERCVQNSDNRDNNYSSRSDWMMQSMKRNKTLAVVVVCIIMMLVTSCSFESSPALYRVTYLGTNGEVAITHEVMEGEMDDPPLQGELPENDEFYWSLTEDGDIFDFSTPITSDITLYPISKSKRVNVVFYCDGEKIASKLCKTGSKLSASDVGFSNDIYKIKFFDVYTGEEFNSSLSYVAEGYSFVCEISSDLIINENGTIKGSEGLRNKKGSYTLNIPRYLNGLKVTSIESEAFSSKEGEKAYSFTSLILPGTLVSIGEKAFMNSKSLLEVTMPRGVSVISDYAFAGCSSLKSFTFQDGVSSIGKGAFSGCTSFSEITIPGNVKNIGEEAFKGCTNLSKVTLSKGVEIIGEESFASCIKLPTIFIPSSVSSIGDEAFYDCRKMTEIIIDKDSSSLPGVMPWGGNAIYNENKKIRDYKDFDFVIKNLEGEELFKWCD